MAHHAASDSRRTAKREPLGDTVAVLMAGGAGNRFWPLSTPDLPKQFLTVLTDRPLYVQAAERARRQTPRIPSTNVILEPVRRNTAAAVILAALIVDHRWPGATMVVMPSDHLITNTEGFRRTLHRAAARARQGGLGAIGVPPTFPATGFGYLRLDRRPRPLQAVRVVSSLWRSPIAREPGGMWPRESSSGTAASLCGRPMCSSRPPPGTCRRSTSASRPCGPRWAGPLLRLAPGRSFGTSSPYRSIMESWRRLKTSGPSRRRFPGTMWGLGRPPRRFSPRMPPETMSAATSPSAGPGATW